MHEWSMLSAHELIEPKSASTSQTDCGSAAILRLRSMSATASPYAAKTPIKQDRMQIWPKLPASMASGARVRRGPERTSTNLPTTLRRAHDDLQHCGGRHRRLGVVTARGRPGRQDCGRIQRKADHRDGLSTGE